MAAHIVVYTTDGIAETWEFCCIPTRDFFLSEMIESRPEDLVFKSQDGFAPTICVITFPSKELRDLHCEILTPLMEGMGWTAV